MHACLHYTTIQTTAKQQQIQSKEASRGDLREVQGVEEEDDVLALVLLEGDLLELAIDDGSGLEGGGNLSNGGDHFDVCVWVVVRG